MNERADSEFILDLVSLRQFELAAELRDKLENMRMENTILKDRIRFLEIREQELSGLVVNKLIGDIKK